MSFINVFISYSSVDNIEKEKLKKHLSPIIHHDWLKIWDDSNLVAGAEWKEEIAIAIANSDIVLLLITADFFNSTFCYEKELMEAMSRHDKGLSTVIPILLKNCLWQETKIARLQAVPKEPVESYSNENDAFTEIVTAINKRIFIQFHLKTGDGFAESRDNENALKSYQAAEALEDNTVVKKRIDNAKGLKVHGNPIKIHENRPKMFQQNDENNAKFILDGFIGLQRQINILESSLSVDRGYERLAILGHLPSFMRLNDLSVEIGMSLYLNWEPEYVIPEYVELVNQRAEYFRSYIEKGGIARDIFFKPSIQNYVENRFTFHDKNEDPASEIQERLEALLYFNKKPNYFLYLLDEEKAVPKFLLKTKVGLVIDLRTTEVNKHFTHSIDGLFTQADDILKEFSRKFSNLIESQKVNRVTANQNFLQGLLNKVKEFSNESTN